MSIKNYYSKNRCACSAFVYGRGVCECVRVRSDSCESIYSGSYSNYTKSTKYTKSSNYSGNDSSSSSSSSTSSNDNKNSCGSRLKNSSQTTEYVEKSHKTKQSSNKYSKKRRCNKGCNIACGKYRPVCRTKLVYYQ